MSTSIAAFVGRTERGPLDKPTLLFNYTDFSRTFGTSTAESEMATSVRLFFENGGTQAYVMRIADGATSSEVTLKSLETVPQDVLKVVAREAGTTGANIRVQIDYNTPTPDSTFNMRVFRVNPTTLVESQTEEFLNVSMDIDEPRYVVDVVAQGSQLVTVEDLGATQIEGYTIGALMVNDNSASGIDDAMGSLDGTLRLRVDGDIVDYPITGGDIATPIAAQNLSVQYITIVADTLYLVRIVSDNVGVSVEALPSGQAVDVATILQMGPDRGGIEARRTGAIRPAPSGLVADANSDGDLLALSILTQAAYDIEVAGTTIADVDPSTTGSAFHQGYASSGSSLLNVREKLTRIAAQFNTKATAQTHPWRCEVQGLRLVFRPTTGDANTGYNATLTTDAVGLADAFTITPTNTRSYIVGGGSSSAFQVGTTGSPGNAPTINDYAAAYDVIRREVDLFNLLILPRDVDIADPERANLWGPASVFCQERRAFLLIDPPLSWTGVDQITGATINIGSLRQGLVKDHAAAYWPRLMATNENGLVRPVDPSGAIAGVMARIDGSRGVFKAPAGLDSDIRGVRGVERMVSDPENGITNPLAVNTIRVFPNGVISWGARTMDGFDNSGNDDYKYVPVRRLALFIEESLYRGLKFAVFEPNDEPLWAQIRLAAGAFMSNLFQRGAFQGQKRSDAYFVKVDRETTTQNDINLGIVNVVVGFAALKPAEFVVVTIQQIAGQVQT